MFLLKKLLGFQLFPLTLCLEIMVIGLILIWLTKRQRLGRSLITMGTLLLLAASFSPISHLFVQRLESTYPPFLVGSDVAPATSETIKWIVVLGEGHVSDPRLPATAQLSTNALYRLVEGIRLHKRIPGSRVILSGGVGFDPVPQGDVLAKAAREIGLTDEEIAVDRSSKDTEEETRVIRSMVGDDRFILVTSSYHMRRSMALFRKAGMNPIPGPAGQLAKESQAWSPDYLFPNSGALKELEIAFHEYIGLAWSKLRGAI